MAQIDNHSVEPQWKRHIWLVSFAFPLAPLLGVGMALLTGNPHFCWIPVIIYYLVTPALDYMIGADKHDLLNFVGDEAEMSSFYRFLVHFQLPLVYFTWLVGAWYAVYGVAGGLPTTVFMALIISHGYGLAYAMNASHEIGHKTDRVSKYMALLMLVPTFYGHFRIEHNRGHHVDVATPKDSATARFGESFWAFLPREYLGGWKRAWRLECERAALKNYSKFSPRNELIFTTLQTLMIWAIITVVLGIAVIPYLILAALFGSSILTSQNYVAHYGLLREQRPDGKFLPTQAGHSWNCDSFITNLTSYNLANHSDHHGHPTHHYQHLRKFRDAPHLPYGYGTMFMIAYIPPLYRRIMDPIVLDYVDGDMDKVLTQDFARAWMTENTAAHIK